MKTIETHLAYWIKEESVKRLSDELRIENVVPPIFEAYGKILHPFEVSLERSDQLLKTPMPNRDTKTIIRLGSNGTQIVEVDKWGREKKISDSDEDTIAWQKEKRRLLPWREVAEKYHVDYGPAINIPAFTNRFEEIGWPDNLAFPTEGLLDQPNLNILLQVVEKHTPSGNVVIYQKVPHTIWKTNAEEQTVLCRIEEVTTYFTDGFIGYLYDERKQWILFTHTDLSFSIVGGNRALIGDLVFSSLEVCTCSSKQRIDRNSFEDPS